MKEDAVAGYSTTVQSFDSNADGAYDSFSIINTYGPELPDTGGEGEEDNSSDGPLSKTGDDFGSKAGLLGMIAVAAAAIGVLAHSKTRGWRRG